MRDMSAADARATPIAPVIHARAWTKDLIARADPVGKDWRRSKRLTDQALSFMAASRWKDWAVLTAKGGREKRTKHQTSSRYCGIADKCRFAKGR